MSRVTTACLLTCAAIGVAGAALLAVGWQLSLVLFATVPFVSVAFAGLWVLPALVVSFIALCTASCVVGTWLGILLADRLRRAGAATLARRKPSHPATTSGR